MGEEPIEFIEIFSTERPEEAALAAEALKNGGIPNQMRQDVSPGFRAISSITPGITGVWRITVPASAVADAEMVLSELGLSVGPSQSLEEPAIRSKARAAWNVYNILAAAGLLIALGIMVVNAIRALLHP